MHFRAIYLAVIVLFTVFEENKTDDDVKQIMNLYPGKANSEHDLLPCREREVCGIVHKRFWFPRNVERYCRCDNGNECSSSWSDSPDNYTMTLNNRGQLKFCEPVIDLPNCMGNETRYLHVENRTIISPISNDVNGYIITSKAECYCPPHHKWVASSFQTNDTIVSVSSYRCAPLSKCKVDEFCGFEREDYYSVYYQCSCPIGHLCVRRNNTLYHGKEMFYSGRAFMAVCTSFPTNKPSVQEYTTSIEQEPTTEQNIQPTEREE